MSDFFKKFLAEDPRRLSPSGRFVGLAAFGKHPGWDDHIEDLGLETDSLILAKTVLYVKGIGGQIDAGAWEKLEPAQQLPAFKHLFVWRRGGQFLIGRLWSSSDGKGRTRYPMVVCLHFTGVTLGWALKQALPALAELEEGCVKTTSAEDVRSLLSRKRAALREAIQSTDGRGEYAPVTPEALHRILRSARDPKSEGFLRVLYQIQSQFRTFATGTFNAHANPAAIRAQQIRVPAAGDSPEQALLFWTRFFKPHVDASVPLLLTLPLEADWLDVTGGEPESHEFFCLRASPKAVPMVSDVPYKLDDTFRVKAAAFLDGFKGGDTTATDLEPAAAPPIEAPPPAKTGLIKWLGIGVVLIIGAVATVLLLPKTERQTGDVNPSGTQPEATKTAARTEPAVPAAPGADIAKAEAARAKARQDAEAEAARLAEERKKSEALAAAAKLKADAEAAVKEKERQVAEAAAKEKERQIAEAAAKEKERQIADAARLEKEKEAARQKELAEQQRKEAEAAAAKKKADEQARAKTELAAAPLTNAASLQPAGTSAVSPAPPRGEMTNSIGMVLVELPSRLWVGKYEVTQAEYRKVMGTNTSKFTNDVRQPVERVTWIEANEFCRKLTEMERGKLPAGKVYSLPTGKQWEEFRAAQKLEDLPKRGQTGKGAPSEVGTSAPPNKFGLFDVLGNVYEWCLDDITGGQKLLKGGAFNAPFLVKELPPDKYSSNCGFRCILASQ
jgi:formylglycine-generating enzyme required for sulfatase activity